MHEEVSIIGGGLSGCEAALQLAFNGIKVKLFDRKPEKFDGAYSLSGYAELVCNNSLGQFNDQKPLGMLLRELEESGSHLLRIANSCKMSDQTDFSVDIEQFSSKVSSEIIQNPLITRIEREVTELPYTKNIIVATGPMTHSFLASDIAEKFGIEDFSFTDASSPIVDISNIDLSNNNIVKESEDVYLVHLNEETLKEFVSRLISGETVSSESPLHAEELIMSQPIEKLAKENMTALLDVKLNNIDGKVVIKLRRAKCLKNDFIISNCTTQLKNKWQVFAFSALPGFENITTNSFSRFGRLHRNTFFVTPHKLDNFFAVIGYENSYIIGQITGIDGYAAAIASGLVAAKRIIYGDNLKQFSRSTMIGALAWYVANGDVENYSPISPTKSLLL
ncbi:MAG: methylenetetrahydrofolate--tRNA-(uracil(54)-C(5))-methyltransferase (FADH(2)-oxidizing) TrmFO [Bacillota bacterium]